MKQVSILLGLLLLHTCSCGGLDLQAFDSLLARQPRVIAVEPTDGAVVDQSSIVAVEFSEQIYPATVDQSTLAIVKDDGKEEDIAKAVVEGDMRGVDGAYELATEGNVAIFRTAKPYESGATYKVIATGGIMSIDMVPLANNPGQARSAFVSSFKVASAASGEQSDEVSSAQGDRSTQGDGYEDNANGSSESIRRPSSLVINEILYDVPGDDTDGVLFVELYGEAGANIGDYKISFINGDNGSETEDINIPSGAVIPADGIFLIADSKKGLSGVSTVTGADIVDNFDPQNGPDCVQLFDNKGLLIDALGYGTPIKDPAANGKSCFEGTPVQKATAGSSLTRSGGVDTGDNATDFQTTTPTAGVL